MSVLDTIAAQGACRLADIVRDTGLERRIVGRLIGSLIAADLIQPTDSGRYELGIHLIDLGQLADHRNGIRAKALPIAENLMRTTRATVIVHRVQNHELVPLIVCMPTDVLAVGFPRGRRIALHEGIGRAALAWLPPEEIKSVLAHIGSTADHNHWAARLETIRASNVVISYGEIIHGVTAVGSPIINAAGRPTAALAVVALESAHPEQFTNQVIEQAATLSTILRAPTPEPRSMNDTG